MKTNIVKNICKLMLPVIQIFGLYVILFGHISPGGGFAGGSIIGSSLIMYRFMYGKEIADSKFRFNYMKRLVSLALILYGILKGSVFVLSFFHIHGFIPTGIPGHFLSGVSITFYFIAILFEEGELENANVIE